MIINILELTSTNWFTDTIFMPLHCNRLKPSFQNQQMDPVNDLLHSSLSLRLLHLVHLIDYTHCQLITVYLSFLCCALSTKWLSVPNAYCLEMPTAPCTVHTLTICIHKKVSKITYCTLQSPHTEYMCPQQSVYGCQFHPTLSGN